MKNALAPNAEPVGSDHDAESVEKAREILSAFYKLQPNLTGLARAITERDDVVVRPSASMTYTDNKDIYLMLNPSMKMDVEHVRRQCGTRDSAGLMTCEACKRYEHVITSLYHEMGHIIFESFAEVEDDAMKNFLYEQVFKDNALDLPDWYLDKVRKKFRDDPPKTYLEYAQYVNPYFPMLLNALEDARVNAGIISRNPGAARMFRADVVNVLRGGVVRATGEVTMWYDQPLNAQMAIGCLLSASLIEVEDGWLDEDVIHALRDTELGGRLATISSAHSARQTFEDAVMVLKRCRDLGFFLIEDDQEEPDEGPGQGDGESGESGETQDSGMSGMNEGDDDLTEKSEGDAGGSGGSGESDSGDDSSSDAATDDATGDDDAEESGEQEGDDEGEEQEEEGSGASGDGDEDDGEAEEDSSGSGDEEDGDEDAGGGDAAGGNGAGGKDHGTPEDAAELLEAFNPHEGQFEEPPHHHDPERLEENHLRESQNTDKNPTLERALRQEGWESTSERLYGLDIREPGDGSFEMSQADRPDPAVVADPAIIQRALGPLRVAFSENRRGHYDRNRRSGRVDARVLARRVPNGDNRLFRKKHEPGKRDYHVVIGFDISGSTAYGRAGDLSYIQAIKTCVLLQAEMLSRVDVPFEIYAHTGGLTKDAQSAYDYGDFLPGTGSGLALNLFKVKALHENFNDTVRERITKIKFAAYNLDGHNMEFYRKRLDESNATDKLIIYYTDGAMPYENYDEELEILKRECVEIKRRGYDVLAVAIDNSDPQQYGLDTVRVDTPADMQKVVLELQRRLR